MYSKKNGRVTFKSNRRTNYKRTNFSNSKGRNKGNVTQQYNKYIKLAKEAFTSGDRVQAEYFYQFTDHYHRLMVEMGINVDENVNSSESKVEETQNPDESNENQDQETNNEKKDLENETSDNDYSHESIESVPFISDPVKKKRPRSNK
tara:strand:+ start:181 stop:624 length:444 start_codon:yes stop_codon:yes gene_type:complete